MNIQKKLSTWGRISRSLAFGFGLVYGVTTAEARTVTENFSTVEVNAPTLLAEVAAPFGSDIIWPASGVISQGFHPYHTGIDIAGAPGTPIVAVRDGVVVKSGWDDWGLGNAITLQHPDGSRTVYGHNRRLLVRTGAKVQKGQLIAEMGSTGNSSGPHLHFELYPNGRQAVNPMQQLPSLVAGRIPTTPVASSGGTASERATVAQRKSPVLSEVNGNVCTETLLNRETENFQIRVCRDRGQLYYVGQSKRNPESMIQIPAIAISGGYQAQNGSFSYLIKRERVEVFRNGTRLHTEYFI